MSLNRISFRITNIQIYPCVLYLKLWLYSFLFEDENTHHSSELDTYLVANKIQTWGIQLPTSFVEHTEHGKNDVFQNSEFPLTVYCRICFFLFT